MNLVPTEKSNSVAYLGPEASFSHQAALSFYGDSKILHPVKTIDEVFDLVEKDICVNGVVPIENSSEGSINLTLDLLYEYDLKITGETFIRIHHQLLSNEDRLADVIKVYSHPMAVAQCRKWLKKNMGGVEIEEVVSTSLAAKKSREISGSGAIGSSLLSETYGLRVLKENIEDRADNITRFLVIGKENTDPTGRDRSSIMFSLLHQPGSLHKALEALAEAGIDMTSIQSRPTKIKNWEYLFFMDLDGHEKEEKLFRAIKKMEKNCLFLKRLGSYPVGETV